MIALIAACLAALVPITVWAQNESIVITNVTVVDGTGDRGQEGVTVVISGDRITARYTGHPAELASSVRHVDGRGRYLIPGLWDMHVHLAKAGEGALAVLVANGVTGVRDMGGDPVPVRTWRSEVDRGERLGPKIVSAGPILESPRHLERMQRRGTIEPVERFRVGVADEISADAVVDSLAAMGVDFIKIRTVTSQEVYQAIARAAIRHGLYVTGHSLGFPPETLIAAGQRSIEHVLRPSLQRRKAVDRSAVIAALQSSRVAVVPTVVNYYSSLRLSHSDLRAVIEDSAGAVDPRRRYVHGYLLEDWSEQLTEKPRGLRRRLLAPLLDRGFRDGLRDLKELFEAGVWILPGTDLAVLGIYPGFSLHDELRHFVDVLGLTPLEALVSATQRPAEFLGLEESHGTIEVGKLANLVLIDADPLEDIGNVSRIQAVFLNGTYLDRAALDSLLATGASPGAGPAF